MLTVNCFCVLYTVVLGKLLYSPLIFDNAPEGFCCKNAKEWNLKGRSLVSTRATVPDKNDETVDRMMSFWGHQLLIFILIHSNWP